MKLSSCFLIALTIICSAAFAELPAQDLAGDWQGSLNIMGSKLRLVFHFAKNDSGWVAALDSPDQGAAGISCGRVSYSADSLIVDVPVIRGRYLGGYLPDSLLYRGVWQQGGLAFPLDLVKSAAPLQMARPQEPKPPYPYRIEQVSVVHAAAGVTLAGTLTLPEGSGPFPALLLISGSGPQDRDEQVFGHRPFWIIADHLSRSGYVVLRYDDRGAGQSSGDFAAATSLDFAGDAAAAVAFLSGRSDIDARRIYLLGHSEGGLIAPMVAADDPAIAGLILLAGPGLKGEEILLAQGELIGRAAGMDEKTLQRSRRGQEKIFSLMKTEESGASLEAKLRQVMLDFRAELPIAEKDSLQDQAIVMQVKQLTSPWFRFFLTYDPAPALSRVKCPVLALNGELDLQVPADANLAAVAAALQRGGHKRFEIHKLTGLNHLFQTAKTGGVDEYSRIEETFSPQALQIIDGWLTAQDK